MPLASNKIVPNSLPVQDSLQNTGGVDTRSFFTVPPNFRKHEFSCCQSTLSCVLKIIISKIQRIYILRVGCDKIRIILFIRPEFGRVIKTGARKVYAKSSEDCFKLIFS